MTSDIENLHLTNSRQRDLLEVKDRQSIESDERERKTNMMIHSAQQLFKAEKDEVWNYLLHAVSLNNLLHAPASLMMLLLHTSSK